MSNTINDDLPTEIDLVSLLSGKISKTTETKSNEYLECENSSNIYSKGY